MELSRTINSDKRYYLDENTIENAASFLQTMRVFNDAKIDLYNALYDQKYLASGPLIDHAYPVFLKEKYKTNDYYNAAVYSAASGSISSQKGLMIVLFNKTIVKLDEYERSMESSSDTLDRVIHESDKFKFIYSILYKPCIFKAYRLLNVQTLCIFPCFCPYEPKQGKFLFSADYLIQQSCGSTLRFPCSVSVNVHCGTDISVSEKFLHIFRCCTV